MQYDKDKIAKIKKFWPYYLAQSALAACALAVLFLILGEARMVLISAIAATAFIVFALPTTASAQANVVIPSHLIGLAAGTIFAFTSLPFSIECPIAVGIAIFLMVLFDIEHPPAAGTAIAAVIHNASLDVWAAVSVSVLVLSLTRHLLRNHLRNLL